MACLNCTSRVLRIFLHTSPLPLRRPAQRRLLPSLLAVPGPATLQRPFYARLATHLTAAREQATLATLAGELTDDDYVPFDYHLAGTIPAAIGADVQSGWPPPVPEAAHMEGEPDIQLTSPHEEGEAVWWDGAEEKTVAPVAAAEEKKKVVVFLKREGYWTLDGGEQTYSLTPKNNKGKRKREREERERLAAAAAALAPSEEKEIHPAVPPPPEEKGIHPAVPPPPEEKNAEAPVPAPAEEEKVDTAESTAVKEHQEAGIITDTIKPDLEEGTGTLSEKASKKAARKAARKAWEEKKAEREAKITLKEAKKQIRTERRTTTESEAANITDGATGKSSGAHRYDQFFSDSPKATKGAPRDPREGKRRPRDRKSSAELPRVPEILTLQKERRLGAVRDVPEGFDAPKVTNNTWNLKIPDSSPEPTRLQKFLATAPRSRIQPWMIYKARLQEKFKGQAWEPPKKLSPDAQEAIRVLRKNHPEFTTTMLAEKFEVSGEAIRRILRSKWREREKTPEVAQEWAEKWAKRGQKVWQRWEEAGVVHTKKAKRERSLRKAKAIEERVNIVKVSVVDRGDLSDRLL